MKLNPEINWNLNVREGRIVYMPPEEYMERVNIFNRINMREVLEQERKAAEKGYRGIGYYPPLSESSYRSILEGIRAGNQIDIPNIVYRNGMVENQEGFHRSLVARDLGIDRIPVQVIGEMPSVFSRALNLIWNPNLTEQVKAINALKGKIIGGVSMIREATTPAPEPANKEFRANANLINRELAMRSHSGTSFEPEKRGEQEIAEFVSYVQEFYERLKKHAKTDRQKEFLLTEMDRFQSAFASKYNAKLSAQGGCISTMIAGPSGFPVRRAEKACSAADKRYEELIEFRDRAEAAILRELKKMGVEEAGGEIEVLKKKIADAERNHEFMVQTNVIVRKKIPDDQKIREIMALAKISETTAREILKPDFMGRIGFPQYALTNDSANIRRMKEHLAELEKREVTPTAEMTFTGGSIVDNREADRVQIFFDQKPSQEIINKLRGEGWRWSPSIGAWQRKRTPQALDSARRITGAAIPPAPAVPPLAVPPVPAPQVQAVPELRWVYGTRDEKWHLVGPEDRDYVHGITQERMKIIGPEAAKAEYLSPALARAAAPAPQVPAVPEKGKLDNVIALMEQYMGERKTYEDFVAGLKGYYLPRSGYQINNHLDTERLSADLKKAGYYTLSELWNDTSRKLRMREYVPPKHPPLLYPAPPQRPAEEIMLIPNPETMTRDEYIKEKFRRLAQVLRQQGKPHIAARAEQATDPEWTSKFAASHRDQVVLALAQGKTVGGGVLKDYPDIVARIRQENEALLAKERAERERLLAIERAEENELNAELNKLPPPLKRHAETEIYGTLHMPETHKDYRNRYYIALGIVRRIAFTHLPGGKEPQPQPEVRKEEPVEPLSPEYERVLKTYLDGRGYELTLQDFIWADKYTIRGTAKYPIRSMEEKRKREEFVLKNYDEETGKKYHRGTVESALNRGLKVPDEVLKDYPDLMKKEVPVPSPKPVPKTYVQRTFKVEERMRRYGGYGYA